MNRPLSFCLLALGLGLATAGAHAQSYRGYDDHGRYDRTDRYGSTPAYDYARVIRVDPVFDSYASNGSTRCYDRPTYVGGRDDDYRRNDGYYDDRYDDGYRRGGSEGGRMVATVLGGVVGAVVGSKVGGGSGRYVASGVGSMVGGMAGRQIYDQSQRQRTGSVRVCDPVPAANGYGYGDGGARAVNAYDVTYEYGGRTYTTRTNHHPGDRIRVRVDVQPE